MSVTKRIAHNTILQVIGKLLSTVLGVFTVALMTRYLGDAGFGQYSTVMTFLLLVGVMIDFGVSMTTVRLMADPRYQRTQVLNAIFTLRLVTALGAYVIAPIVALALPFDPMVKLGIAIAACSFFFVALNQVLNGVFQIELRTDKIMIAENLGRVLTLIGIWYAIVTDGGLALILWAVVAGSAANFSFLLLASRTYDRISLVWDMPLWRTIVTTTWPIALSIIFNLIYFKADTLILALTRTQAEVGIYSAPYRVLEILITFPYLFVGIVFPLLTKAWAEKNHAQFATAVQRSFDALVYAALPIAVGTQFVARDLMTLIGGSAFSASGPLLQLIIVPTAFIFINVLFGYVIVVVERQRQMVWAYAGVAVFALTLYILLIPRYGMWAAAIITVISELAMLLANMMMSIRITGIYPRPLGILKSAFACTMMCLPLIALHALPVIPLVGIAIIVYAVSLYAIDETARRIVYELAARV